MPRGAKRKPTTKQQKFIDLVVETGNRTEAAAQAYNVSDRQAARAIAYQNMHMPHINDEINKRLHDAKDMIYNLSQKGKSENVRLSASQDIVDRLEGKPVQTIKQATVNYNIDANTPDDVLEEILKLSQK